MSRTCGWRASALALVVVAAGCSDGVPTQPEPQYNIIEEATIEAAVDESRVAMYRAPPPTYSSSVSTWIGPAGGSLRLLDFEIVVPPGAVAALTKFRIKLPGDPKKLNRALAEFQPHDVTFGVPVTLRLPYSGTTAEGTSPSVIWWNDGWIRYPTQLLPDGRVETMTTHFSFFGTELLESTGITPVGG